MPPCPKMRSPLSSLGPPLRECQLRVFGTLILSKCRSDVSVGPPGPGSSPTPIFTHGRPPELLPMKSHVNSRPSGITNRSPSANGVEHPAEVPCGYQPVGPTGLVHSSTTDTRTCCAPLRSSVSLSASAPLPGPESVSACAAEPEPLPDLTHFSPFSALR